jgi:hypothetical protein
LKTTGENKMTGKLTEFNIPEQAWVIGVDRYLFNGTNL